MVAEMRHLVTFKSCGRYGRFANQAYSIAGCLGIARKNGFDFALTEPWRNHDGLNFEPDLDIDVYKHFVNPLPIYDGPELPQIGIEWGYHDVKLTHSCDLLGHFQSEKYFSHALEEIRWYMRVVDEPPLRDVVAVHWRAGDYGEQKTPQHPDGNSYHPRMALDYYEPAMNLFPSKTKFLVFSDDIPLAKKMFGNKVEYSEGRTYMNDFKLMKTCSSFIIANSSFSAFAAVLGESPDKQVVAPDPWFGGPYLGRISAEDIYNPEWTIINWETGTSTREESLTR
jgi:hypothetical protein